MADVGQPGNLPPEYLAQTRGPRVVAGAAVVFSLATIAVICRIWARRMKRLPLGADDWWAIAALPFCLGMFILDLYCAFDGLLLPTPTPGFYGILTSLLGVEHGLGKHIQTISKEDLQEFIKATYAFEMMWALSLLPVKLSIVELYKRIFGSLRYIRITTFVVAIYSVAWTVMVVLACGLQCIPARALWAPPGTVKATCINIRVFFFVGSALDLVVFLLLLFLPLIPVWNLQKSVQERVSIMAIFLLGSLTVVITVVRLVELILNQSTGPDPSWTSYQVVLWSTVQPCLGTVCACLPTMTPLLRSLVSKQPLRPKTRYYNDYSTAAGRVHSNSKGVKEDPYSSTGRLHKSQEERLGLRGDGHGFRAERSEALPPELADLADPELARDMRVQGNVYALTTIDIEEHRTQSGIAQAK